MRFIEGMALGAWQANCYLFGDLEQGTCVVVDPGQTATTEVRARLEARGVRCEAILCTHGHIDHIWSAPELAAALDVPVFLHPEDRWLWDDPGAAFSADTRALAAQMGLAWELPEDLDMEELHDGQRLVLAGHRIDVRHTPGHTPGSSVFLLPPGTQPEPVLLAGDLIFAGSVGRTDLAGGSWEQEMASIERVVLPLPDETLILSGHGPETTVGRERAANPFLQDLHTA